MSDNDDKWWQMMTNDDNFYSIIPDVKWWQIWKILTRTHWMIPEDWNSNCPWTQRNWDARISASNRQLWVYKANLRLGEAVADSDWNFDLLQLDFFT